MQELSSIYNISNISFNDFLNKINLIIRNKNNLTLNPNLSSSILEFCFFSSDIDNMKSNKQNITIFWSYSEIILQQLPFLIIDEFNLISILHVLTIIASLFQNLPKSSNYYYILIKILKNFENEKLSHELNSSLSTFFIFSNFIDSIFFNENFNEILKKNFLNLFKIN